MHANITQACTHHAPTPTQTTTPPTRHTHTHTKMTQIHAKCLNVVRISYEIRTKFVTTTFTVRIEGRNSYEIRTKFARNSYDFRTNFVRTSYESRTIFAGRWQKSHTNTTYACTGVPTPTHISLYLPPRHPHTHKVQQCTHTHTPHRHTHTHTHTQEEGATPSFMYPNIQRSSRGGSLPPPPSQP